MSVWATTVTGLTHQVQGKKFAFRWELAAMQRSAMQLVSAAPVWSAQLHDDVLSQTVLNQKRNWTKAEASCLGWESQKPSIRFPSSRSPQVIWSSVCRRREGGTPLVFFLMNTPETGAFACSSQGIKTELHDIVMFMFRVCKLQRNCWNGFQGRGDLCWLIQGEFHRLTANNLEKNYLLGCVFADFRNVIWPIFRFVVVGSFSTHSIWLPGQLEKAGSGNKETVIYQKMSTGRATMHGSCEYVLSLHVTFGAAFTMFTAEICVFVTQYRLQRAIKNVCSNYHLVRWEDTWAGPWSANASVTNHLTLFSPLYTLWHWANPSIAVFRTPRQDLLPEGTFWENGMALIERGTVTALFLPSLSVNFTFLRPFAQIQLAWLTAR